MLVQFGKNVDKEQKAGCGCESEAMWLAMRESIVTCFCSGAAALLYINLAETEIPQKLSESMRQIFGNETPPLWAEIKNRMLQKIAMRDRDLSLMRRTGLIGEKTSDKELTIHELAVIQHTLYLKKLEELSVKALDHCMNQNFETRDRA